MNTIDRRNVRAAGFLLCAVFVSALIAPTAHAQWNENGNLVAISGATSHRAIPDGGGGAFLAWQALSAVSFDIYVQHIDPAGNPTWATGGVNASGIPTTNELYPSVVADGAGGVFVAWTDGRDSHLDIYVQHIDETGTPAWAGGIGAVIWPGDQMGQWLVNDGSGGIIVSWMDRRDLADTDIRAQRMNASGAHMWPTGGALVCAHSAHQTNAYTIPDGSGGILAMWSDSRNLVDEDLYANYLEENGIPVWSDSGVVVSAAAGDQLHGPFVSDGAGGLIATWDDNRGGGTDVYAQRVDVDGNARWANDGIVISDANLTQSLGWITEDGRGGAVIVWRDGRDPLNIDIYAQRVDADGYVLWDEDGTSVCAAAGGQYGATVARITPDMFVVSWDDPRNGPYDVYAQGMTLGGQAAWTSDGVLVSGGANGQYDARIAADATGSAILAFNNSRSGRGDLFAQRIEWRHGEWGHPECELMSIEDVPADEGGYVSVKWNAAGRDRYGQDLLIAYQVWRAMEPPLVAAAVSGKDGGNAAILVSHPGNAPAEASKRVIWKDDRYGAPQYWELVGLATPEQLEGYMVTVGTTRDSVSTDPAADWYKILSHASDDRYWESGQMPGYSVDNLAPVAPMMLSAQRTGIDVELEWSPSGVNESDFKDYVVYRGTTSGITPEPIFYLSETPDSLLTDTDPPGGALYYIVTSRDIHDNESSPSNEAFVDDIIGIEDRVPAFTSLRVDANIPNPFSATTELRVGLPEAANVTVDVFDVAGRRVATREAALDAGWQSLRFDGRDTNGRLLPSGVYFYRVTAAGETITRKLVIQR